MKPFTRAVDRFCVKHPRFGISNLMLYIVIANAVVYLFSKMDTTGTFISYLQFRPALIFYSGQVWRLFTFMLIPEGSNLLFVALFLYFYYFIGTNLEHSWGTPKFTLYYAIGFITTLLYGLIVWFVTRSNLISSFVSVHFLNLSMFLAFATLYPETEVLIFFIIPVKVKWLAILDALYFLLIIFRYPFTVVNLLPLIALLNYYLFCGPYLAPLFAPLKYRMQRYAKNVKPSAAKPKKSKESTHTYKCSVCGRTDTDYPNLEFRYCSRCEGYHCFCQDHINNHIHFKE